MHLPIAKETPQMLHLGLHCTPCPTALLDHRLKRFVDPRYGQFCAESVEMPRRSRNRRTDQMRMRINSTEKPLSRCM